VKKSHVWILVAIIALPVILGIVLSITGKGQKGASGPISLPHEKKIGLVEITGIIYESDEYVRQLRQLRKDKSIAAVVMRINSGGGGVAASQEIYEEVKNYRHTDKPLVVSMGSVAASGGYYVAIDAHTIFANPGTITGSFGVILQFPHVYELSEKVGIDVTTIKSGEFKDIGNPHRPVRPREREMLSAMIESTHTQFAQAIARGRHISLDSVQAIADGRIFNGAQARRLRLVDTLGTYREAVAYCKFLCDLPEETKVVSRKKPTHFFRELMREKILLHIPLLDKLILPPGLYFLSFLA
jgi:protease-4